MTAFVHRAGALGLFAFLLSSPAAPRQIKVTVNEVIFSVTVSDEKGMYVDNLEAKDFRILDGGKPQTIRYFSHDRRSPTVVGFLVDLSNQGKSQWEKVRETVKQTIWSFLSDDLQYAGYLISYSNTAELAVNTTHDPELLTAQLDRMKPSGGSALFAAIRSACVDRTLEPGEPVQPRHVIIVFGDGHDNASPETLDQTIELALAHQVTIFGVSTAAFGLESPGRAQLEKLANATGGRVEYPLDNPYAGMPGHLSQPSDKGNYAAPVGSGDYAAAFQSSLNRSVRTLLGEITTQYVLSFVPSDVSSERKDQHRRFKVEIPLLPSVKIRARSDYSTAEQ